MKRFSLIAIAVMLALVAMGQWSDNTYRTKNIALRDTLFFADVVGGKYVATSVFFYHDSANNRLVMAGNVYAPDLVGGGGGGGMTATLPLRSNAGNLDILGLNGYGAPYAVPVTNSSSSAMQWIELLGTAGQITITKTPSGITFSLPQSIDLNSNVQFGSVTATSFIGAWNGSVIAPSKLGTGTANLRTALRGDGVFRGLVFGQALLGQGDSCYVSIGECDTSWGGSAVLLGYSSSVGDIRVRNFRTGGFTVYSTAYDQGKAVTFAVGPKTVYAVPPAE